MLLIAFQSPYKMHFPDDIKHPLQHHFSVSFLVLNPRALKILTWRTVGADVTKYSFFGGYYRMTCVTVLFMDIV